MCNLNTLAFGDYKRIMPARLVAAIGFFPIQRRA